MIETAFRTSQVINKSGHTHVIHWTEKGRKLWSSGDMCERDLVGLTKKGRKFFGIGCFIKDELDYVIHIVPQRSLGWKAVNEIKGVNNV